VTILTAGSSPGRTVNDGVTTIKLRRRFDSAARHEAWFGALIAPYLVGGRFDAVHSMMPRDAVTAVWTRRLGLTRHRTVYDEMGSPWKWWWADLPDRRARERVVRSVDVYGCMSKYSLGVLQQEWNRQGVLIPGGVRLSEFAVAPSRAERPTVLFSGAFAEPRKGLSTLLEAIALLAEDQPDVRLWLSGSGDATPFLTAAPAAARTRTEVLPLGNPDEQGQRYGQAWATTLPSVDDSFGVALIESLACGTPIVVANHAAPPELVTPETGTVSEPKNPESLADALRQAFALAQKPETADRCRSYAARFDWDSGLAPLLERLYADGAQHP
jgi:glycosyltransferase involved in cell wall biosynthesis